MERYRFIARIIFETNSPICISSGQGDFLTDSNIQIDVNDLPYIPGTTLAGVIRHSICAEEDHFFGKHDSDKTYGSRVIFSDGYMIGAEGKPITSINLELNKNNFYTQYFNLPIRHHVKIGDKGTGLNTGKFDNYIVYKGTRFCFEVEMIPENKIDINIEYEAFINILSTLYSPYFRIGGKSRSGLGEIEVKKFYSVIIDLKKKFELTQYLNKSSNLADNTFWNNIKYNTIQIDQSNIQNNDDYIIYEINIKPVDTFIMGSDKGDDDVDLIPVTEKTIVWKDDIPSFTMEKVLIPASSIKGALSHRTAFYYNKEYQLYADENQGEIGSKNRAVSELFGSDDKNDIKRGNILISDIIENDIDFNTDFKIFNHIRIDKFTGGCIEGALYSEKVVSTKHPYNFKIIINNEVSKKDKKIIIAFEKSLNDLVNQMLPIGRNVNKGNGRFFGECFKNGKKL